MGEIKQINIKNRTCYFYNDIIDLDEFDGSKIKVDKKNFNDIDIYYLGYEYKKKITECNEINSVNPLYLRIKDMKGQFKKGKSDNVWYLIIFGDADVLRIFANIWKSIRTKIEENTSGIEQYDEDYMRIKFESNDNLFALWLLFFKDIGFKFEDDICNKCHDLLTKAHSSKNVSILNAKENTYRCILMGISKNEGLKRLNNSVTYHRGVL